MEKYYLFLMANNCNESINSDLRRSILQLHSVPQTKEMCDMSWLGSSKSIHAAQVCLCCDPENIHKAPDEKWFDVTTGCDVFNTHLSHNCPDQLVDRGRTAGLSEVLHDLANELAENGAYVNIIWPVDIVKHLQLSDNLALFGGLKRLVEWHQALVHFVLPTPSDISAQPSNNNSDIPPTVQTWVDLLHGNMVTGEALQEHLAALRWCGNVNITGSKDTKALNLQHFCLTDQRQNSTAQATLTMTSPIVQNKTAATRVMSSSLEFIAVIRHSEVPSLYITHHTFRLSVPSSSRHLSKSTSFLDKLCKDRQAAYILRLHHGTQWKDTVTGSMEHAHQKLSWKELIMDNIANVNDHKHTAEVDGDVGYCQFLVRYEAGVGPLSGGCIAYRMRDLKNLNGNIAIMLAKDELQSGGGPDSLATDKELADVEELLSRLPHYKGSNLLNLVSAAGTVQLKALRHMIEMKRGRREKAELSLQEFAEMLKVTHNLTWDALAATNVYTSRRPTERLPLKALRPDYDSDVMSQSEGVSLRLREVAAGVQLLKRPSDDSLGGLAPPTGQVVTLDASEFLKHFNEDGTATRTDGGILLPLMSPSRRFCKYDRRELTKSKWPTCLRARDHDIYYNCEERDALERQCERMKVRLQAVETASTCTLIQGRCPTTITINDPPDSTRPSVPVEGVKDSRKAGWQTKSRDKREARGCKRKAVSEDDQIMAGGSKRLLEERKKRCEKARTSGQQGTHTKKDAALAQTRSQRHKRKLVEVVEQSIIKRGITKGDAIFSACVNKLYTLTKCFVKDLKTSHNLRQEMEKIAESHVEQVINFEKRIKTN